MKWKAATTGAVLLAVAGLCYFLQGTEPALGRSPEEVADASSVTRTTFAEPSQHPSDTGADEEANVRRLEAGTRAAKLLLTVRDGAGQPQSGRVFARCTPCAPSTSDVLAPEYGHELPQDVRVVPYSGGSCDLEIPVGNWAWIRVTGPGPVPLSRYLRIEPFTGQIHKEVVLDSEGRGLHTFVMREDLSGPAAACTVTLYKNEVRAGGPLDMVATSLTDDNGYCRLSGLGPGAYLVTAGQAAPSDLPPWTHRFILPPGGTITELPCTLVEPPHRHRMTIEVMASIARRAGRSVLPRLYFVPLSGKGELVVSPITLNDGQQHFDVWLREGSYECRVLPIGELHIDSKVLSVTEDGPREHSLFVADAHTQTQVELKGIGRTEFPVHVRPRALNAVIHGSEDELFTGPWSWFRATGTVRSTADEPVTLVVSKRHRFWLSAKAVSLSGGRAAVDLVPAARIQIEVPLDGLRAERRTGYATVSFAGESLWVALRPALVPKNGRTRAVLMGTAVVPIGPLHIVGYDGETSEQLWERTVEPKSVRETITIGT